MAVSNLVATLGVLALLLACTQARPSYIGCGQGGWEIGKTIGMGSGSTITGASQTECLLKGVPATYVPNKVYELTVDSSGFKGDRGSGHKLFMSAGAVGGATCVNQNNRAKTTKYNWKAPANGAATLSVLCGHFTGIRRSLDYTTKPLTKADRIKSFCGAYAQTCTANSHSTAYADCAKNAAAMTEGKIGDKGGDTFGCREYHMGVASTTAPGVHCKHAAASGGGVCVPTPEQRKKTFCASYIKGCANDGKTYGDAAACITKANAMVLGAAGATGGNSFSCREYHLKVALAADTNRGVHCPHAAPLGGGVCQDNYPDRSNAFCSKYASACKDDGTAYSDCKAEAAKMILGKFGDTAGATFSCREYHLGVAVSSKNTKLHCPHASLAGGGVCVKPKAERYKEFCATYLEKCDKSKSGGTYADCAKFVAAAALGVSGATGGDSFSCREYHLSVAVKSTNFNLHCPHASQGGANVCVVPLADRQKAFCKQYATTCGTDGTTYGDEAKCIASAKVMSQGATGAATGNSFSCREYHLGVAVSSKNTKLHCPHASLYGGGQCEAPKEERRRSFCGAYSVACEQKGKSAKYINCMAKMKSIALGVVGATGGDSFSCREYHLGRAGGLKLGNEGAADPDKHCPHAQPNGGGVCAKPKADRYKDFCSSYATACGTDGRKYADCAKNVATMTIGDQGATGGDSFSCREYHLGVAVSSKDTATHCPHASSFGGGACASPLGKKRTAFCSSYTKNCVAGNFGSAYNDCEAQANALAVGDADKSKGDDTFHCREYHLGVAVANGPKNVHCPHASASGAGVCASPLNKRRFSFCAKYISTCKDTVKYAAYTDCLKSVTTMGAGTEGATGGDSFACREYHLGAAAKDAATHCPHASLLGGGVCVVPKEDEKAALAAKIKLYCKDYGTTCAGKSMAYADVADCIARATKFPVGEMDAKAGNSLTCRVYHLGVAKTGKTADPKKHCPHASLYGGNVCADERGKRQFQFCASYKKDCKNDGTAYKNCLGVVDAMGRGNVDDPGGDTFECREYHLGVAIKSTDYKTHCPHASTLGGGVCVKSKEDRYKDFCKTYETDCAATSNGAAYTDCLATVASFAPGSVGSKTAGDTLSCREYHLSVAISLPARRFARDSHRSADNLKAHCPHASFLGGNMCIKSKADRFTNFCSAYSKTCLGARRSRLARDNHVLSAAYADCQKDMEGLALGDLGAVGGDSFSCREYHLGVATKADPQVHCKHAAPSGGGVCAKPMAQRQADFCASYKTTCGARRSARDAHEFDKCADWVKNLSPGKADATGGDSFSCREYHLGAAQTDAKTHCPHASSMGGGVCSSEAYTSQWKFCKSYTSTCADTKLSDAWAACMKDVAAMAAGDTTDTSGDTFGCRQYHLAAAQKDAKTHCPHSSKGGGNVCVKPNDNAGRFDAFCKSYPNTCGGDSGAKSYTANKIMEMTEQGNKDKCFIALFQGEKCNSAGGVYQITPDWTTAHFGGSLIDKKTCGQVIDNWTNRSPAHNSYLTGLKDKTDIMGPLGKAATYVGAFDCALSQKFDDCKKDVQAMVLGKTNAAAGDSFACREYHLSVASKQDPALHCPHASPSGGNVCIRDEKQATAEKFCGTYTDLCAEFSDPYQKCEEKVLAMPEGKEGDKAGNSLACRSYHLSVAQAGLAGGAPVHCAHAAANGGRVCDDASAMLARQSKFCTDYTDKCSSESGGYSDCLNNVAAMAAGKEGDTGGHTFACREYHLGAALGGTAGAIDTHCPHASPDGGLVCVPTPTEQKEAFCKSYTSTCTASSRQRRDAHLATPIAIAGGGKLSEGAKAGGPGSVNALNSAASKHEPYLEIAADRTMTISVRGGGGSTTALHPQTHGKHWIEFVYVKDQDGKVVCKHQFDAAETSPVHKCPDALPASVTTVTSYEYCNLHGLWTGPTLKVAWEVDAAKLFARATQSTTVSPTYFHSPAMVDASKPAKHEPKMMTSGRRVRREGHTAGPQTTIVVLGTGGSDVNLHPHTFDTHYIEAVFAKDQHGSVAVYQVLADNVKTAQSKPLTIPASATSLVPYEFCNLHGLWAGATFTPPIPEKKEVGEAAGESAGESAGEAGASGFSTAYSDCMSEVTAMTPGVLGDKNGDTFGCRQYHLSVAASGAGKSRRENHLAPNLPQIHCPHSSKDGGGVCVDKKIIIKYKSRAAGVDQTFDVDITDFVSCTSGKCVLAKDGKPNCKCHPGGPIVRDLIIGNKNENAADFWDVGVKNIHSPGGKTSAFVLLKLQELNVKIPDEALTDAEKLAQAQAKLARAQAELKVLQDAAPEVVAKIAELEAMLAKLRNKCAAPKRQARDKHVVAGEAGEAAAVSVPAADADADPACAQIGDLERKLKRKTASLKTLQQKTDEQEKTVKDIQESGETANATEDDSDSGLSAGAIAGIVIAIIVLVGGPLVYVFVVVLAPDAAASKDAHGAVTNNAYEEGAIVVNANAEA